MTLKSDSPAEIGSLKVLRGELLSSAQRTRIIYNSMTYVMGKYKSPLEFENRARVIAIRRQLERIDAAIQALDSLLSEYEEREQI